MLVVIATAILTTIGLIAFVAKYRLDSIGALFFSGLSVFYIVTGFMHIEISTYATGFYFGITGGLFLLVWIFHRANPLETLPRGFSWQFALVFGLFLFWFGHHIVERNTLTAIYKAEFFKWAYSIVWWVLPISMGAMFSLNKVRLERFMRANAVLAIISSLVVVIGYFTGLTDVSETYGARYSFNEKLGGLDYAMQASTGAAFLLAGYVIGQPKLTPRRLAFVSAALTLFAATTVIAGTRSSLIAIFIIIIVCLATFRIRYLPIGTAALIVGALLFSFVVKPLLPSSGVERAMTSESVTEGIGSRIYLVKTSLNILSVSPAFGRTMGLQEVIEDTYSHNFTLQVMVETGLVGLAVYLAVFGGLVVKLTRCLLNKGTLLFTLGAPVFLVFLSVFIEAHAHGSVMNWRYWFFIGLVSAHSFPQSMAVSEEQLMADDPNLAYAQ